MTADQEAIFIYTFYIPQGTFYYYSLSTVVFLCHCSGSEKLKEWISLEGEGNKAPRIRIAHPVTAMKFEGTRKRRREAMGNYVWSIGDQVDAWMHDG